MKEIFEIPMLEIIRFNAADVIATSGINQGIIPTPDVDPDYDPYA